MLVAGFEGFAAGFGDGVAGSRGWRSMRFLFAGNWVGLTYSVWKKWSGSVDLDMIE